MNKDRADVPLSAQLLEFGDIGLVERFHGPPARVAAEDLHAGATKLEGALDR